MKVSSVNPRWLEIGTDLEGSETRLLGVICRAAYGVAVDSGAFDRIKAVRLMSSDGEAGGCA